MPVSSLHNLAKIALFNQYPNLDKLNLAISSNIDWKNAPPASCINTPITKSMKIILQILAQATISATTKQEIYIHTQVMLLYKTSPVHAQLDYFDYTTPLLEHLNANKVADDELWKQVVICSNSDQLNLLHILTQSKTQDFQAWKAIFLHKEKRKFIHTFISKCKSYFYSKPYYLSETVFLDEKNLFANPTFILMLLQAHDLPASSDYLSLLSYIIDIIHSHNREFYGELDLADHFRNIDDRERNEQQRERMKKIIRPAHAAEDLRLFMKNKIRDLRPVICNILALHPDPQKLVQAFIYLHKNQVSNLAIWKQDPELLVERYLAYLKINKTIACSCAFMAYCLLFPSATLLFFCPCLADTFDRHAGDTESRCSDPHR